MAAAAVVDGKVEVRSLAFLSVQNTNSTRIVMANSYICYEECCSDWN